jgi:hypothetical protein
MLYISHHVQLTFKGVLRICAGEGCLGIHCSVDSTKFSSFWMSSLLTSSTTGAGASVELCRELYGCSVYGGGGGKYAYPCAC